MFPFTWPDRFVHSPQKYTDSDLAKEMNALTFQERQSMEEDIHGVGGVIDETPILVETTIARMMEEVDRMPLYRRDAWDRATFLKPSLLKDERLFLMILRARRFDATASAILLVNYFETKRTLFGDDLLIHRITWQDLTTEEQDIVRSGIYRIFSGREQSGRGISWNRLSQWDFNKYEHKALMRTMWYLRMAIEDDPEMQRRGIVSVGDFRGTWCSSPHQVLHFSKVASQALVDNAPFHLVSIHAIMDNPTVENFVQTYRKFCKKENRLRHRLHTGSSLEIQYSLRTFGIVLGDHTDGIHSPENIEQDIRQRQEVDRKWRESEARFRDPLSPVALFPNPQDIILGRNKKVGHNWQGNTAYNRLIASQSSKYAEVNTPREKTAIANKILEVVTLDYQARFLSREKMCWEAIGTTETLRKISQALRTEVRRVKQTLPDEDGGTNVMPPDWT